MRSNSTSILVLILCLTSAVKAVEEQENQQGRASQQDADQPPPQQSFQLSPLDLTSDQLSMAREGIRAILSQVPAQTVEPLFETMDGYCKAFDAVCSLACEERGDGGDIDGSEKSGSRRKGGCMDKSAMSVSLAQATCVCAGYDLTDRVNFAVIGGVVSSKSKPTSDFTAEGFLDGLTFIPGVPIFLNIVHGVQSVCHFLDTWVDSPSQSTPPSSESGATTSGSGGGILGSISSFLGGLFGGKTAPSTPTDKNTATPEAKPEVTSSGSSTATKPVATTKPVEEKGGFLSWLPHLWAETDSQGQLDDNSSQNEEGAARIISRDGRIARITRVQQRHQKTLK
ncbi:hypothetical protein EMPS_02217 [Entomortierella parvispora]|uniref:Uncharacterized protein n=1 Tax=Entomortierella parvispora TaxID=205924 RepID=A0A9P3H506_9FUNG|nr:hypothetical protein EMPS_02217 [Entomortierella parvispora]